MDYLEAKKTLNGRKSKKLQGNTYLHQLDGNEIGLRLHETYIIRYSAKHCKLFTGGWNTLTTRDRLRTYGPVNVTTKNNILYIGGYNIVPETPIFYEGVKVGYDGRILSKIKTGEALRKKNAKIKKRVNDYIAVIVKKIERGAVSVPNGGDCWHCLMKSEDGKTMGDLSGSEHIIDHMREKYVVPSLIVNALLEAGYKHFQLPIILGIKDDKITEVNWNLKNAIRRYLLKRFIMVQ